MSTITERQYEEALRDWLGPRAVFHPRWRTMDSAGSFNPHGVLHHWTAMPTVGPRAVSPADQATRLQFNGALGLSAHLSPARDGRVFVIAGPHANANHAGNGDPDVWAKVLAGRFDGTPVARRDVIDGNERLYGFEYQYHPDDGPMPDEQVEAGILAAAALSQAHGWSPDDAAGSQLDHYEWTARKWDRELQDLANRTRAGVRLALINRQEEDMPSAQEIAKAVVDEWESRTLTIRDGRGEKKTVTYKNALNRAANGPVVVRDQAGRIVDILNDESGAGDDTPHA